MNRIRRLRSWGAITAAKALSPCSLHRMPNWIRRDRPKLDPRGDWESNMAGKSEIYFSRVSLQGIIYRGCSSLPWLPEANPTGELFGDNFTFWYILDSGTFWWNDCMTEVLLHTEAIRTLAYSAWKHCLHKRPYVGLPRSSGAGSIQDCTFFRGTGNCDLKGLACCYKIHFCWFDFLSQFASTWNPIGRFSPVAFSLNFTTSPALSFEIRSDSLQSVLNIPTFFGGYPVTLL